MKTIMIVDDDADIRNTLKALLESNKYKTILAVDGADCFAKLNTTKPDLILLDIMMPGISGWDVCSKVKSDKKTSSIPIFFLTAKSDGASRAMGLQGAEDYIEKPFDVYDLLDRIKRVI